MTYTLFKNRWVLRSLPLVTVALAVSIGFSVQVVKAGTGDNTSGYAWSDTIGWISLNNLNAGDATNYGVNIDTAGNFSGYAWSDNIGWVSFNASQLSGCPSGSCAPFLDWDTGIVSGWARACAGTATGNCGSQASRTDGWDGWIRLSGLSVNTATGDFSGFAWGSDVVGWVDFSNVKVGNLIIPQCSDGVDNADAEDILIDMADPGCTSLADTSESNAVVTQCNDGVDGPDLEDTLVDMADPGCTSLADTSEANVLVTQCNDGVDNTDPEDVLADMADPGCTSASDTSEIDTISPPTTQCSDGIDNDGDGKTDFNGAGTPANADPGCASATDTSEFNIGSLKPR